MLGDFDHLLRLMSILNVHGLKIRGAAIHQSAGSRIGKNLPGEVGRTGRSRRCHRY